MTDPEKVALRLMGISVRCEHCFHWEPRHGIAASKANNGLCAQHGVHKIYSAGAECQLFVPRYTQGKSEQWLMLKR